MFKYVLVLISSEYRDVPTVCYGGETNKPTIYNDINEVRKLKLQLETLHKSSAYLIAEINYLPAEEQ